VEDVLLIILLIIVAWIAVMLAAAGILAWRVWRSGERRLARRIGKLPIKRKMALGRDILSDPRIPAWSRILAGALIVYLASPLDLIPDFIPVIGFLDDLLIVLVAAGLLIRSIPDHVLEQHLQRHETEAALDAPRPLKSAPR
jgi:uncharacterized membrane protein YkvA (DUF1232 family)